MNVKEVLEKMGRFSDEERSMYLGKLCAKLTPMSCTDIKSFQMGWDGSKPFEKFKEEQNEVIKDCVGVELSGVGQNIRKIAGMENLSLDTVI